MRERERGESPFSLMTLILWVINLVLSGFRGVLDKKTLVM